ncbi:hypothetical protein ACSBR2_028992 [Camellia fascicularis]
MSQLAFLDLFGNQLTGPIPFLNSLKVLDLSNNNFSGIIPYCLGNFSNNLSVLNSFHGTFTAAITKVYIEMIGLVQKRPILCVSLLFFNQEAAEIKDEAVEKDDVQEVDTDVTLETNTVIKSTRPQGRRKERGKLAHAYSSEDLGGILGRSLNSIPWKMGVMLRRVLPICGKICFFYPSLRARSRQPVKRYKNLLADIFPRSQRDVDMDNLLLRVKNEKGNISLHEALMNGHQVVAYYLIAVDPEVLYYLNNEVKSALFLAAKLGLKTQTKDLKGVLDALLKSEPRFIRLRDEEGRTPLHLIARLGYLEEVQYLLGRQSSSAIARDNNGLLPIHLASIEGHVDVVWALLQCWPDSRELLNCHGQNILHVAAKSRGHNMSGLIVNNEGMSALDSAEYYMERMPSFRKAAGAPQAYCRKALNAKKKQASMQLEQVNIDSYKDRFNTLLLVSTLVATVTFAAGCAIPSGYNNTEPDQGMPTMLKHKWFHMFVFCDTIAMYSSIITAVTLIWAQLGDLNLVLIAYRLALPLLGIALTKARRK